MPEGYFERGATRSGRRFAQANFGYYATERELLAHHQRLLEPYSDFSTRYYPVGRQIGSLMQTTVRFAANYPNIQERLLRCFSSLFRQHTEDSDSGFEVLITFNAILSNPEGTSFSLFYGQDYRAGNLLGASPELRYGDPYMVRVMSDVLSLPTTFNFEDLARAHRFAFENSGVRIARFLNIVYLIYQFLPTPKPKRCNLRRPPPPPPPPPPSSGKRSKVNAADKRRKDEKSGRQLLPDQGSSGIAAR